MSGTPEVHFSRQAHRSSELFFPHIDGDGGSDEMIGSNTINRTLPSLSKPISLLGLPITTSLPLSLCVPATRTALVFS